MFKVTKNAAEKIEEIMENEDNEGKQLRLYLESLSWKGPRFNLALEELVEYNLDEKINISGIPVVYENKLSRFLTGKILDYVSGAFGSEFKVYDARGGFPQGSSC